MNTFKVEMQNTKFLNGQLLIAMPGMKDKRFARAVIFICAHSQEGAMGLILNQRGDISFPDILIQLGIIGENEAIHLPHKTSTLPVRHGGPVDSSRGFVLHSDDYNCKATLPITDHIGLTATVDILKAISTGKGPQQALITLGYAGWGAGQLEAEIADNGWLIEPTPGNLIFTDNLETQYDLALKGLGINPAFLMQDAGHS